MELLDIYNENGKKTGKVIERGKQYDSLKENEFIAIAQIYIENDKGEYLMEKSSKSLKEEYCPVGGHILHGEEPYQTILRETKEELGIDISKYNINSLGFVVSGLRVRFIYYLKYNIKINELSLQKDEVQRILYMTPTQIKDFIQKGLIRSAQTHILKRVLEYKKEQEK